MAGAHVGAQEGQAGHPSRVASPGQKEIGAGFGIVLQVIADAEDEGEVDYYQEPVDKSEMRYGHLSSRLILFY
jgi:hypothetical protein